jgi:hypothetical protein
MVRGPGRMTPRRDSGKPASSLTLAERVRAWHCSRAASWGLLLVLLALVGTTACRDTTPVEPAEDTRSEAYYPASNPGGCASYWPCLRDDVAQAWEVTETVSQTQYVKAENLSTPMHAGGILDVLICYYRRSDDELTGCSEPHSWAGTVAQRPDSRLIVNAQDATGVTRVGFRSRAFLPVPEIVSFERPAHVVCSSTVCQGPFRLRIRLEHIGYYSTARIDIVRESATGVRYGVSDSSPIKDGDEYEWSWNSLGNSGPGGRLVITFRPWGGYNDGMTVLSVPFGAVKESTHPSRRSMCTV